MRSSLEGLKNRFEVVEERITELEDRSIKIIQSKEKRKKNKEK